MLASFASVTVADSPSTAHVKTSLAPGCTLTTKFSVRRAQDTNSLFHVLQWWKLTKAFRVHQSRIGSCCIRSGYHRRARCLRKVLWQLRQSLDVAFLLSLLQLQLLQRLAQLSLLRNELVGIHFLVRRHSKSLLCLLTQALSSRPELVPAIRYNYRSATMIAKYARSVRALCPMITCFQRQMS